MYSDFRDQNGNAVAASVVLEAIKRPVIKTFVGFEIYSLEFAPRLHVTEEDIIRSSFTITNNCASDGIKLGSVNIGMVKVTIKNEKFAIFQEPSELIDCHFSPQYKLEIDDNTTVTVFGGEYWVKEVEQFAEGVKITCYDSMCKLDEPFTLGTITGTPYQILTQATTACNVPLKSTQAEIEALPNGTRTFTLHSDNDCKTWRDVLSYLSMLMGCFVTFARYTYGVLALPGLVVRPFGNGKDSYCDTVTDVHRYKGAKFSIFDTEYKAIELTAYAVDGGNTVKKDFTYAETTGVTGQTIKLGYNPFIQADTPKADLTQTQRDILHELLTQVSKYAYTPMQISLPVGFIYDLGDVIKCTGGLANTGFAGGYTEDCYCCISNYTYTYGKEFRIKTLDSHAGKGRPIIVPGPNIYGVEWNVVARSWTRTDNSESFINPNPYVAGATEYGSPFDNIMPWSGIKRVSDPDAGELVKIPKFWFKMSADGSYFRLQIADREADGFSVAPAFMDRGDGKGERDFVYVGRYHCSSSNYKSNTGVIPKTGNTRAEFRTNIHNLGSTIWQWDYAMLVTIQMLYIVEFANWESQEVIGGGCTQTSATSSAVFNCGGTDSMPYHTGTVSASHSDYGDCQYRYMEMLWGNCYDFCDGIYFSAANVYAIKNPADFSDQNGGVRVTSRSTNAYSYIYVLQQSYVSGFEWFYFPTSSTSREPSIHDEFYSTQNGVVLVVGGYYYDNSEWSANAAGLFRTHADYPASHSVANHTGSRLMVLP